MAKIQKSSAGKRGESVRSDCYVEIELKQSGGIKLKLKSKVESMYGERIRKSVKEMCKFFNLKNAMILIEDNGALPFTLQSRFESAVKRLMPGIGKEFLPEFNEKNKY